MEQKRPTPESRVSRYRKPARILLDPGFEVSGDIPEWEAGPAEADDHQDEDFAPRQPWIDAKREALPELQPLTDQDDRLARQTSNLVQVRCRKDTGWLKDGTVYFGTVYRPPQDPLHECLRGLTKDVLDFGNVVLTGDFNVHIGANGDPKTDEEGLEFQRWCRELKLTIINCTDLCHGQFSREEIKKKRGVAGEFVTERSTVDYVLVSESMLGSVVDLTLDSRGQFGSDHKPLVLTLRHSTPPKPRKRQADYHFAWRRPTEEQAEVYAKALDEAMTGFLRGAVSLDAALGVAQATSAAHAENLLASWQTQIYQCGLEYIGRKKIVHGGRNRSKGWFTVQLRSLRASVDSMRTAVLKAQSDPLVSPEAVQKLAAEYGDLQQQWLHAFRKQKGLEEVRINNALQDTRYEDPKRFWSLLKCRKGYFASRSAVPVVDEQGEPCSGADAAEVWRRQYERTGTVPMRRRSGSRPRTLLT